MLPFSFLSSLPHSSSPTPPHRKKNQKNRDTKVDGDPVHHLIKKCLNCQLWQVTRCRSLANADPRGARNYSELDLGCMLHCTVVCEQTWRMLRVSSLPWFPSVVFVRGVVMSDRTTLELVLSVVADGKRNYCCQVYNTVVEAFLRLLT